MKRAFAVACAAALAVSATMVTAPSAQAALAAPVSKIVFTDEDNNLFLVHADGTGLHAITSSGDTASPSFAPGGKRIAYIHGGEVWVTSDGGTPRQVTHTGGSAFQSAWSPDGNWIAFTAPAGTGRDVFRIHPWGGAVLRTTFGGGRGCFAESPAWAPDSTRIAYVRDPGGSPTCLTMGIVVQKLGGGSGFVAVAGFTRWPSFTADGKHLVYVAPCGDPDICGDAETGWLSTASGADQHMVAFEHLCAEGDLCLQKLVGAPDRGWVESLTFAESDDPNAIRETCFQGAHENSSGTVVLTAPQFCLAQVLGGDFDVH